MEVLRAGTVERVHVPVTRSTLSFCAGSAGAFGAFGSLGAAAAVPFSAGFSQVSCSAGGATALWEFVSPPHAAAPEIAPTAPMTATALWMAPTLSSFIQ